MKNVTGRMVRKLYINQVVMAVFGVIINMSAFFLMEGYFLVVLASLLAIGMYLFIIYDAMWNAGAKDASVRLRAEDAGLDKIKTPFYIVLFASLFNIAGAVFYAGFWIIVYMRDLTEGTAVLIGDAVYVIMNFANGMYTGFDIMLFPHPHATIPLEQIAEHIAIYGEPTIIQLTPPWFYFLIPVPLFITGILAYYTGASETKLLKILKEILGYKSENN